MLCQKKLFLLDMDGTLYIDNNLFPETMPFLTHIKEIGGRYLFLTNNSSKGIDSYIEKMDHLGIQTVRQDFLTSTDALISFLYDTYPMETRYYGFGTASFRKQLRDSGLNVSDIRSDDISVLLCGFDTELTFQKLEDACILLNNGVDFIATNPDWVCPTWYGSVPDCGSVCQMLTRATGRNPKVIGKPAPEMAYLAMKKFGFTPEETVMIGDRLYTDVACGVNAGIDTVLVLSGEATLDNLKKSDVKPTYVLDSVGDIFSNQRQNRFPIGLKGE